MLLYKSRKIKELKGAINMETKMIKSNVVEGLLIAAVVYFAIFGTSFLACLVYGILFALLVHTFEESIKFTNNDSDKQQDDKQDVTRESLHKN